MGCLIIKPSVMKFFSNLTLGILVFTFLFIGSFNVLGQSSRSVNVSNFSAVNVHSDIDLYLTQGDTETLLVKGKKELIKDVVVEQKSGSLTIRYKEGINWNRLFSDADIKVYLTYKKLNAITANGGSDVETQNTLNTDKIKLQASGGADMELFINCKNITVAASGGSDIELKGSAENMVVSATGGSDIDAYEFKVNYVKATASGGSDLNLFVEKGLEVNATSGSDIKYKGNAALKKTQHSKSSDIVHVR